MNHTQKARQRRAEILESVRDQLKGLVRRIKRIDQHPLCQPSHIAWQERRRFGRSSL